MKLFSECTCIYLACRLAVEAFSALLLLHGYVDCSNLQRFVYFSSSEAKSQFEVSFFPVVARMNHFKHAQFISSGQNAPCSSGLRGSATGKDGGV